MDEEKAQTEEPIAQEQQPSPGDTVELGGSIQLTGFQEFDGGTMIVLKKIIGNYAKKYSDICKNFEQLSLRVKPIHQAEDNKKFQVDAKVLNNGKPFNSNVTDKNIFVAVGSVLKKIESELS